MSFAPVQRLLLAFLAAPRAPVAVVGEPGVGKTAFLQELARVLRSLYPALTVYAGETPLRRWLYGLSGALEEVWDNELRAMPLLEQATWVFIARNFTR